MGNACAPASSLIYCCAVRCRLSAVCGRLVWLGHALRVYATTTGMPVPGALLIRMPLTVAPPDHRCFLCNLWRSPAVSRWLATFRTHHFPRDNGPTGEVHCARRGRLSLLRTFPPIYDGTRSWPRVNDTSGGAAGAKGVQPLMVLRRALHALCASHSCDLAARAAHSNGQILLQILLSRSKY